MLTFSWTADVLNSDSASLLFSSTELVNYDHVFNTPGTNLKKREKNSEKIKEESVCVGGGTQGAKTFQPFSHIGL